MITQLGTEGRRLRVQQFWHKIALHNRRRDTGSFFLLQHTAGHVVRAEVATDKINKRTMHNEKFHTKTANKQVKVKRIKKR